MRNWSLRSIIVGAEVAIMMGLWMNVWSRDVVVCGGCDADATLWETRFHVIREGLKTIIGSNSST